MIFKIWLSLRILLNKELERTTAKWKELEELISKMKSKICSDTMTIRHGLSENESLKREIDHLQESINHFKTENNDMK